MRRLVILDLNVLESAVVSWQPARAAVDGIDDGRKIAKRLESASVGAATGGNDESAGGIAGGCDRLRGGKRGGGRDGSWPEEKDWLSGGTWSGVGKPVSAGGRGRSTPGEGSDEKLSVDLGAE